MMRRAVQILLLAWSGLMFMAPAPPAPVPASSRGLTARETSPASFVTIGGGSFKPLYAPTEKQTTVMVNTFRLNKYPVTNAEFLRFVEGHPRWQKSQIAALFADERYLQHWAGPITLGDHIGPDQPVTYVSWFAAKAYCEAQGARQPSELEWEYAAASSPTATDGRTDPAWVQTVLGWYSQPGSASMPAVGRTPPNIYGVYDLHGLIWEWVLEFNSTLISSDSREGKAADKSRFCGGGAISATDKADYASFMRYAFRTSLQARYTTSTLGFRCANDP